MDAQKNFAYTTVATAPSPATSGTSLVLTSAADMPAAPFSATLWPALTAPSSANGEIVRVTALVGTTATIVRAQEGTTARTVTAGWNFAATPTKESYFDPLMAMVDIHAATPKTTPADDDEVGLIDSAASWALKKLAWANIKATLKTYFDTLYSTFDGTWASLSGKPSTFTPSAHAHPTSEVTGLDAALAGKLGTGDTAADVNPAGTAIAAALAGKAATNQKLDDFGAPDDNTDLDASASAHGLMPKSDKAKLDKVQAAEVDVASVTTTDIGAAASDNVRITGTTTITGLGTVAAGTRRFVRFAGALTLTHNATSLILPGAANITTAANDRMIAVSLGSGNWLVVSYTKADGTAVVASAGGSKTIDKCGALGLFPGTSANARFDYRGITPVYNFADATTDETMYAVMRAIEGSVWSSGVKVYLDWMAKTATGDNVIWEVAFCRLDANNQDHDSLTFDAATLSSAAAANATCGKTTKTEITVAAGDTDGISAGDAFMLMIRRKQSNGSDTMSGDAQFIAVEVRSAA